MYEEDRQRALALYAEMFDMAASEQELIQHLGSPTKQAVLVARSYNAKTRGLAVNAKFSEASDKKESDEIPAFVAAILKIRDEAFTFPEPEAPENADQISMFDADPVKEFFDEVERQAREDDPEESMPESTEEEPSEIVELPAEPEVAEPAAEDLPQEEQGEQEELEEQNEPEEEPAEEPAAEPVPEEDPSEPVEEPAAVTASEQEQKEDPAPAVPTKRKVRPFLLVLYILFAVPVCAVGTVILLLPTLACFAAAFASIFSGVAVLASALAGIPVVADLLFTLGMAVILFALGLLFLWAFLWFVLGVIGGLIRGAIRLGGKWCYKEVPING